MTKEHSEVIDGIVYVVPYLEPFASGVKRVGPIAVFLYCRWDAWGIGIQALKAGCALQVGPFMFGLAHVEKYLAVKEPTA